MMIPMSQDYRPAGFTDLTLHLSVKGASDYIEFLKKAFNAEEVDRSPMPDGRLMHATVRIGDACLMLNDLFPEMGMPPFAEGNLPFRINLYVPDADAQWAQAIAAGCTVVFPLQDQFWGDRYGQVSDPKGFVWAIATRKEHLTREELNARAKKMFGG
jgi:PhnB protein